MREGDAGCIVQGQTAVPAEAPAGLSLNMAERPDFKHGAGIESGILPFDIGLSTAKSGRFAGREPDEPALEAASGKNLTNHSSST